MAPRGGKFWPSIGRSRLAPQSSLHFPPEAAAKSVLFQTRRSPLPDLRISPSPPLIAPFPRRTSSCAPLLQADPCQRVRCNPQICDECTAVPPPSAAVPRPQARPPWPSLTRSPSRLLLATAPPDRPRCASCHASTLNVSSHGSFLQPSAVRVHPKAPTPSTST